MNLLNLAASVLSLQTVSYQQNIGRTVNDVGQDISSYATAVTLKASVQPIARALYEQMGLDLQKSYATVYISTNSIDIERDISGDLFVYNSKTYLLESNTDWFAQDGWISAKVVQIA